MKSKLIAASVAAIFSVTMFGAPALAHQQAHPPGVQSADGVGVVKAIDPKGTTITLQHEAIPALKWPAMTMTFAVEKPTLLTGVTVGEKVSFELTNEHGKPVVTDIDPR